MSIACFFTIPRRFLLGLAQEIHRAILFEHESGVFLIKWSLLIRMLHIIITSPVTFWSAALASLFSEARHYCQAPAGISSAAVWAASSLEGETLLPALRYLGFSSTTKAAPSFETRFVEFPQRLIRSNAIRRKIRLFIFTVNWWSDLVRFL